MEAVIQELLKNYGLNNAKRVIFSGCSAGGEGTYYLLDHVRSLIPANVCQYFITVIFLIQLD